ncbi:hypothetical protein V6N13_090604 [Hibiscus sabdariffa]
MVVRFVMGLWGVVAPLFFIRSWRHSYYQKLEHYGRKIYCDANSNSRCIVREREALLKLKNDLTDPTNSISSWVETGDCCKWNGVLCNNITGHVTQLHLVAPTFPNLDHDSPLSEWKAYYRSKLGGTINLSLLQLKHLTSLNLNNNDFSPIQIPGYKCCWDCLESLNTANNKFFN